MSEIRDNQRELFQRVKGLAELVDKILFEIFPSLNQRGYKADGSDNEKPLGFGLIDRRLGKLELYQMLKTSGYLQMLMPPFPGLYRLCRCEAEQRLAALKKKYPMEETCRA